MGRLPPLVLLQVQVVLLQVVLLLVQLVKPASGFFFWWSEEEEQSSSSSSSSSDDSSVAPSPTSSTIDHTSSTVTGINNSSNSSHTSHPFTIIFLSDLETNYRGHDVYRSRYVINYIEDLGRQNLTFDGEQYNQYRIDPKLVIHGGDIGHLWSCFYYRGLFLRGSGIGSIGNNNNNNNVGLCHTPQDEMKEIWHILYEAQIPMISSLGNHDWYAAYGTGNPWFQPLHSNRLIPLVDRVNQQSSDFVKMTYQRSAALFDYNKDKFEYEEIPPTGKIGQSMYRINFRGIQIVSFNSAFNWQSYDPPTTDAAIGGGGTVYNATDQFDRLMNSLYRSREQQQQQQQPTIFFSHWPLSKRRLRYQPPTKDYVLERMARFASPQSASSQSPQQQKKVVYHFSGHYHTELVEEYRVDISTNKTNNSNDDIVLVRDYVAPYPHKWGDREPGVLAILVSPEQEDGGGGGVLQVKSIPIPGLEDGTRCTSTGWLLTSTSTSTSTSTTGTTPSTMTTPTTTNAGPGSSGSTECHRCKAGRYWFSFWRGGFICGQRED